MGCVLAGKARTQRLGRIGLHVAAASTQSARFAVRGGTPVPKNSVLIVGATGTLGGLNAAVPGHFRRRKFCRLFVGLQVA